MQTSVLHHDHFSLRKKSRKRAGVTPSNREDFKSPGCPPDERSSISSPSGYTPSPLSEKGGSFRLKGAKTTIKNRLKSFLPRGGAGPNNTVVNDVLRHQENQTVVIKDEEEPKVRRYENHLRVDVGREYFPTKAVESKSPATKNFHHPVKSDEADSASSKRPTPTSFLPAPDHTKESAGKAPLTPGSSSAPIFFTPPGEPRILEFHEDDVLRIMFTEKEFKMDLKLGAFPSVNHMKLQMDDKEYLVTFKAMRKITRQLQDFELARTGSKRARMTHEEIYPVFEKIVRLPRSAQIKDVSSNMGVDRVLHLRFPILSGGGVHPLNSPNY